MKLACASDIRIIVLILSYNLSRTCPITFSDLNITSSSIDIHADRALRMTGLRWVMSKFAWIQAVFGLQSKYRCSTSSFHLGFSFFLSPLLDESFSEGAWITACFVLLWFCSSTDRALEFRLSGFRIRSFCWAVESLRTVPSELTCPSSRSSPGCLSSSSFIVGHSEWTPIRACRAETVADGMCNFPDGVNGAQFSVLPYLSRRFRWL